jgi:hypothetical protein
LIPTQWRRPIPRKWHSTFLADSKPLWCHSPLEKFMATMPLPDKKTHTHIPTHSHTKCIDVMAYRVCLQLQALYRHSELKV